MLGGSWRERIIVYLRAERTGVSLYVFLLIESLSSPAKLRALLKANSTHVVALTQSAHQSMKEEQIPHEFSVTTWEEIHDQVSKLTQDYLIRGTDHLSKLFSNCWDNLLPHEMKHIVPLLISLEKSITRSKPSEIIYCSATFGHEDLKNAAHRLCEQLQINWREEST